MPTMNRRSSFLAGTVATIGTAGILSAPARAAQYTYKVGTPDGVDFPITVGLIEMAKSLRDETRGRFELQVFPNSALGSPSSMLSQLRLGSLEMVTLNHSLYAPILPVAQINSLGFAFASSAQALAAFDGPLGAYVRKELGTKDMYVFPKAWDAGFKEVESPTKPIRTVDDFAGFRIRSIPAAISVELFRALGASPIPLEANEIYSAMQTHIVDGVDESMESLTAHKYYDVLKYLTVTNHAWGGYWTAINTSAWAALPADIQAALSRNLDKYVRAERSGVRRRTDELISRLKGYGMAFNVLDPATVRPRLGAYYAHWKSELGTTAWNFLEGTVGKLT
jgi:TRAP-type transport system periplasmic protein